MPVPRCPDGANERAHFLNAISERAKSLARAIQVSEHLAMQRAKLDPGTSRARLTTANAKWMRAAEDRDRKERNFFVALEAAGYASETRPAVKDHLTTQGGAGDCQYPHCTCIWESGEGPCNVPEIPDSSPPSACLHPNSCDSHGQCMYVGRECEGWKKPDAR